MNNLIKRKHYSAGMRDLVERKHHSEATKKKIGEKLKGDKNPNWRGGISKKHKTTTGYIYVYQPEHPYCTNKGMVFSHRLVMEKRLGRFLEPNEQVHHKNGIKNDNRWWNLELITKPHYGKVECPFCGEKFLIR